jgi:hypothetical protein
MIMSLKKRGSTPGRTDWPTVSRDVTCTCVHSRSEEPHLNCFYLPLYPQPNVPLQPVQHCDTHAAQLLSFVQCAAICLRHWQIIRRWKPSDPAIRIATAKIRSKNEIVGFKVLTAVSKKMAVFWVIAPCSLVEIYLRFRSTCCLHHQSDHHATTEKTAIFKNEIHCLGVFNDSSSII